MARRNMVTFEADERLERLLEKRVKSEGMRDRSEYLRYCILYEAFTAGDADAAKLIGEQFRLKLAKRFGRLFGASSVME
jgi:hypothetical protein